MRKNRKKLILSRETLLLNLSREVLRHLDPDQLNQAAAGGIDFSEGVTCACEAWD